MDRQRRIMVAINVLGGIAVIGSYIWGFGTRADAADVLWGGVPAGLQPVYTANMLLAALGYFCFGTFLLLRTDASTARVAGRWGLGLFNLLFLVILVPSALWMPLSLAMAMHPSVGLWVAIVADLALVGLGALGLLAALLALQPRRPTWHWVLAVIGAIPFCVQTALLDAIIWTAYYPL